MSTTAANDLKTLAGRVATATATIGREIDELRGRIKAKRKELRAAENAPVPRDELEANITAAVAQRAESWMHQHGHSIMNTPRFGRSLIHATGRGRFTLPDMGDMFGVLCAAQPEQAAAVLRGLVSRVEYAPGTSAHERPAQIARLRAELAALEAAEEQAIDSAIEAGVEIKHRPEVVNRRQDEAAERERIEQRAENARQRQAALDAAHAARGPRTAPSSDLADALTIRQRFSA